MFCSFSFYGFSFYDFSFCGFRSLCAFVSFILGLRINIKVVALTLDFEGFLGGMNQDFGCFFVRFGGGALDVTDINGLFLGIYRDKRRVVERCAMR